MSDSVAMQRSDDGQASGRNVAKWTRRFVFFTGGILLGAFLVLTTKASEFTVSGEIIYRVYLNNSPYGSMTNTFEVYVKDCNWFIRAAQRKGTSGILYYETGSDGTSMYTVEMINTNVSYSIEKPDTVSRMRTNNVGARVVARGIVAPGTVPVVDLSLTTPVWLAYASECYFQTVTNALKPVWQLDRPEILYLIPPVRADWKLFEREPFLPRTVNYFSDGKRYHWDANSAALLSATNELSPFDNGFTRATYVVTATTNVGGQMEIPLRFVLRTFIPDRSKAGVSSNDIRMQVEFEGTAFSVMPSCNLDSLIPHLPAQSFVRDFRTTQLSPPIASVQYLNTNDDDWLPLTNKSLTSQYKTHARVVAMLEKRQPLRSRNSVLEKRQPVKLQNSFFVLFGLGSSIGVVAIFFAVRHYQRSNSQHSGDKKKGTNMKS